jgi:hypothetical protein
MAFTSRARQAPGAEARMRSKRRVGQDGGAYLSPPCDWRMRRLRVPRINVESFGRIIVRQMGAARFVIFPIFPIAVVLIRAPCDLPAIRPFNRGAAYRRPVAAPGIWSPDGGTEHFRFSVV